MKTSLVLLALIEAIVGGLLFHVGANLREKQRSIENTRPGAPTPAVAVTPSADVRNDTLSKKQFLELLRLRGQVGVLRSENLELRQKLNGAQAARQAKIGADNPPKGNAYYSTGAWANVGYQTPQASTMTFFWAMKNVDQSAYEGALGKQMPPLPKGWSDAFQGIQGVYISGTETSPDGSTVVSTTELGPDGKTYNSFIKYREENGQWLIHSVSGFPVQMVAVKPLNPAANYSFPAGP